MKVADDHRVKDYEKSDGSFAKKQGGILNAIFLINWANHFLCQIPATISSIFFQQQTLPKDDDDDDCVNRSITSQLPLMKPSRSGFVKTNRTRHNHKTPRSKSPVRFKSFTFVVMRVYQVLLWLVVFTNDKSIHYSQGRGARPSKQTAMRILVFFWVLPSCCEAGGGRQPNITRNDLNSVILVILLVWMLRLLYVLLRYRRLFLSRLRQPVDSIEPPSRKSYPTDSATFSYAHDVLFWQNVPGDIYGEEEHSRVEPAVSPQLYPLIEARRLEGVPNSSLVVNGDLPEDRSRQGSNSSDDTIGSVLEFGVGIPEEDGDIVSFNAVVERGVSNISPCSSVYMDMAEQQAESSDSDE